MVWEIGRLKQQLLPAQFLVNFLSWTFCKLRFECSYLLAVPLVPFRANNPFEIPELSMHSLGTRWSHSSHDWDLWDPCTRKRQGVHPFSRWQKTTQNVRSAHVAGVSVFSTMLLIWCTLLYISRTFQLSCKKLHTLNSGTTSLPPCRSWNYKPTF